MSFRFHRVVPAPHVHWRPMPPRAPFSWSPCSPEPMFMLPIAARRHRISDCRLDWSVRRATRPVCVKLKSCSISTTSRRSARIILGAAQRSAARSSGSVPACPDENASSNVPAIGRPAIIIRVGVPPTGIGGVCGQGKGRSCVPGRQLGRASGRWCGVPSLISGDRREKSAHRGGGSVMPGFSVPARIRAEYSSRFAVDIGGFWVAGSQAKLSGASFSGAAY